METGKIRVLIVDDNEEARYLLATLLKGVGHEVASAWNGAEALATLRIQTFDMIITDALMPVMDGFQLCMKVKQDERLRSIPLVFYTGAYIDEKDEELALTMGAHRFIHKPQSPDEILKILTEVLAEVRDGKTGLGRESRETQESLLQRYNERVVNKLEQKMQDLQKEIAERKRVEEALQDSEEKLKAVVYGSPIPKFGIDRDHKIIYWNKALEEITGIKAGEIIGTKQHWKAFYNEEKPCLADLVLDGDLERIPDWYGAKVSKSKLLTDAYEATDFFPMLGSEGTWLHFTAGAIRDSKGSIVGAVETLEDITESKRAEEALLVASRYNRALIETSVDPFVTISPDGRISDVNTATEKVTGYPCDKLIGTDFSDYFTEPDKARAGYQKVLKEGFVKDYDLEILHRDGHVTPVTYSASVYRDESGGIVGIFAAARDITVRKRTEEALRLSEEKFSQAFLLSPDPIVMTRFADGVIVSANEACMEILGYETDDLIGKSFLKLNLWDSLEDRNTVTESLKADGRVYGYESRFCT